MVGNLPNALLLINLEGVDMYWVLDQESSFWRNLGWELSDFYEDDVAVFWRMARKVVRLAQHRGERFSSPFVPNDTQDVVFGSAFLFGSYIIQGGMILFGPPPVKAAGAAFAAFPGMDPVIFGLGVYVSNTFF